MATEALVFEESPAALGRRPGAGGRILELRRCRLELGGVLIDQVALTTAVERIHGFLRSGSAHQVITVNLDFLSIAERNARFREVINRADLAVADGMPLVWLSRLKGEPLPQRITGHELVDECCRLATESGEAVFLLGAAPGVADAAARTLETDYPGLRVAGTYSPPFGPLAPAEEKRIVQMIRRAAPGFLFVALGPPRQDLWIRDHLEHLDVPVCMGVGCVFDMLAGQVSRAPIWMQRAGLEWIHRLIQEPRRLWRRYILDDMPMLGRLVLGTLGHDRARVIVTPQPAAPPPA